MRQDSKGSGQQRGGDFISQDGLDEKKYEFNRDLIHVMTVKKINPQWWDKVKKEAGIKSAGLFKRADASVGKNIKKFQRAMTTWIKTTTRKNQVGDNRKLDDFVHAAMQLDDAFNKFLRTKEFKTDLAVELQGKITELREELKDEIKNAERNRKSSQKKREQLIADLTKMGLWS